MDEKIVRDIVSQVLNQYDGANTSFDIPVEVSARHVHLSQNDIDTLFDKGYSFTPKKDLSQPGQYLCEERVKLVTKKGQIDNVAILGPARSSTQVEVSITDAKALGLNPPINMSGDLSGADDIYIVTDKAMVKSNNSVIIAKAHIHMTPNDATNFNVSDNEHVRVRVNTNRPVTFDDVVVRVNKDFKLAMHVDVDEANACQAKGYVSGEIIK